MRIYIVVEVERDSMSRTNCAVYPTEKQAQDHLEEMDECAGVSTLDWEIEEWFLLR